MHNTSQLADVMSEWSTWTPTLTWTAATPISVTTVARYKIIGKNTVFFIYVNAADGNNSSGTLAITLPVVPKNNNIMPSCSATQRIGGATPSARGTFIRDDGTDNEIQLSVTTATAGSALYIFTSGNYEIV